MAFIDKLLNKFNKVKQAVNSLKGIQSKIQAINYTTAIDALGEEKKAAEDLLNARRVSLEKSIGARNQGQEYMCKAPPVDQDPAGLDFNPFKVLVVELYHICPLTGDGGSDVTDTMCVPRISLYVPIINPCLLF